MGYIPIHSGKKFMFLLIALIVATSTVVGQEKNKSKNAWEKAQLIIDNVKPPTFPNKTYNIIDFGAVADGNSNNTLSINNAIKACSKDGGGKVVVPSGKYFTGPINLENNVNLYLEDGAEILFSTNPNDYPIVHTSFEGTELMNYSPLIYAYKKYNVAVTGKGTLNGQANNENW